jgi:hypothetical protein
LESKPEKGGHASGKKNIQARTANDIREKPFFSRFGPGLKMFFREMAISALLGLGLGFIFNNLILGLILGAVYGLANCFAQK